MIKGKLPHGLLRHLDHTHRAWLKHMLHMHDMLVECAVTAFVACIPSLLNVDSYAHTDEMEAASHDGDSDSGHDATSESELSVASGDDAVDEADYDADRLRKERASKVLRPDPLMHRHGPPRYVSTHTSSQTERRGASSTQLSRGNSASQTSLRSISRTMAASTCSR